MNMHLHICVYINDATLNKLHGESVTLTSASHPKARASSKSGEAVQRLQYMHIHIYIYIYTYKSIISMHRCIYSIYVYT